MYHVRNHLCLFILICFFVDAGVVGNYSNAQIIVRSTSSGIITGILNTTGQYVTDAQLMNLNASQGILIRIALAWCTRYLFVEAVSAQSNGVSGSYTR